MQQYGETFKKLAEGEQASTKTELLVRDMEVDLYTKNQVKE